mmetsp:Transcript_27236/g.83947  ORF Transcript_27236/g.83947 Transcript_27236/m.83947 type:complete len:222 (-) Transcript_27236:36-701(-)
MRPAAAVLLLLTSCGALDHQLKRRRVVVRGGATAAARPTKRKIVAALATSTAAGSLAVLELRESLHVIGHHHGLALLAFSRGAGALADLENLALESMGRLRRFLRSRATVRWLSGLALIAAGWEVVNDLKPGGHHGMVLLALHELHEISEEAIGASAGLLGRLLRLKGLKLGLSLGALGFAAVELVEDLLPGAHHGVAVIALANVIKNGSGAWRASGEEGE